MNADCAYFIGQGHMVCQDYAAVQMAGGRGWAFLADGCSGSPDTDIGARLLVRAAACLMPEGADLEAVLALAASCAENLGLPQEALDATLLTMEMEATQFRVQCTGDGVVALERRDGTLEIHSVQYPTGCPDYLSYRLHSARQAQFMMQHGGKEITTIRMTPSGATDSTVHVSAMPIEIWTGEIKDYRTLAVFSDGVHSFHSTPPSEDAPDVAVVVGEMMAFKTRRGSFVQRRASAFRRECTRRGWSHADDVSAAVLQWGDE